MCGIAGIFDLGPDGARPAPDLDAGIAADLAAMTDSLVHRGPDDRSMLVEAGVGLGHTRLAIVDIAGGRQPMHNEDRTVSVVFNGEIFNHVELRETLAARGHRFTTRSDTEVIVHAYEEHGLDFVHHFNGQWAIALWDRRRRRLVLARDRVGVRPLFFVRSGGRLLFASEIKALARARGVGLQLEPRALGQAFVFWAALDPMTAFRQVQSLPPGHLMVVENGDAVTRRFWDWRFPTGADAFGERPVAEVAEELRSLLVDAVRLRLRSDVPVGAYLSGGLDSSIVTSIIKKHTDTPVRSFSVTFEDADLDESGYQQTVIDHLGTVHSSWRCTRADVAAAFPRAIWHAETAVLRTAPAPFLLLSQAVREHGYKVVLTGEGADEVFGGYDIFKEAQVRRFWARRPRSRLRPALLGRLYPYLTVSPTASPAYAESFFGRDLDRAQDPVFSHLPRWSTTRRAWRFFSPDIAAALGSWDPTDDLRARLPRDMDRWPALCRDQYIEAHTLLSPYLLSSQGDRMAMANAVEGRFPFLDVRVIALASGLPVLLKVLGLKEKFVLRKAFADLLPAAIVRRPKQPYRAPDSSSFFVDGRPVEYVAQLLAPKRVEQGGIFDAVAVDRLVEKCRSGRASGAADNMAFVGVLSTMLLDEMFVKGSSWSAIAATTRASGSS